MANGIESPSKRIVTSPTVAAVIAALLAAMGGAGGFVYRAAPEASADHDQITTMAVELRMLKEKVDKIADRSVETHDYVKRLYYSLRRGEAQPPNGQ